MRYSLQGCQAWRRHQRASCPSLPGDSLSYHNGKSFSTYDADHDSKSGGNCAVVVHGAWWYGSCYRSNLNGHYATSPTTAHKYGIDWASGLGVGHPYRRVRIMLR